MALIFDAIDTANEAIGGVTSTVQGAIGSVNGAIGSVTGLVDSTREAVGGAISSITNMGDIKSALTDAATGGLGSSNKSSNGDGTIPQTERAFTVRPRSTPATNAAAYTAERGPISSIKLITDKPKADVISGLGLNADSSAGRSVDYVVDSLLSENGWSDFLMTSVDVSFQEKVQVNEVFGDSEVVYYFGRSPVTFNLSGIIFDDVDNNWFYNFVTAYASVLRGTQMAKNYQLAKIMLPNMTIVGTITGMAYSQDSSRDTDIRFQMQFLAKSITPRPVLLPSELLSNDALKIDLADAILPTRFKEMAQINQIKSKIESARAYLGSTIGAAESAVSDFIGGVGQAVGDIVGEAREFFDSASNGLFSLAELRANIFSPVYGVLTTLTKVVQSITGDIASLLSPGTSFIGEILRDVRIISNEAIALTNAITDGIDSIVGSFESSGNDLRRTIQALKNAAGAISSTPENVTSILKRLSKSGRKKGYIAQLKNGRVPREKKALINSGSPYKPSDGAVINN